MSSVPRIRRHLVLNSSSTYRHCYPTFIHGVKHFIPQLEVKVLIFIKGLRKLPKLHFVKLKWVIIVFLVVIGAGWK